MQKTLSTLLLAAALAVVGCSKKTDAPADKVESAKPVTTDPAPAAAPAPAPVAAQAAPAAPATPPAATVTIASDDEYMQKGTATLTKLTDTFKADGKDCDKLAGDIDTIHSDPQVTALEVYEKAHPDVKKKFDKATKDQTKAFETAATPTITACAKNQKLMDVLAKFN